MAHIVSINITMHIFVQTACLRLMSLQDNGGRQIVIKPLPNPTHKAQNDLFSPSWPSFHPSLPYLQNLIVESFAAA